MNQSSLSKDIENVSTEESAITTAKRVLSYSDFELDLKALSASYLTGKARKALSLREDGWLVSFKIPVPEGSSPDCMWVELYPKLGKYHIPDIL
jgi:hypothetical protein